MIFEIAIGVALGLAIYHAFTTSLTLRGMLRAAIVVVGIPLLVLGGLYVAAVFFEPVQRETVTVPGVVVRR